MFYDKAANAAKVNEKNFIDIFNRKFSKLGFTCETANADNWYNAIDAFINYNGYKIFDVEIKTRNDWNGGFFQFNTFAISKNKIDRIKTARTLLIFTDCDFINLYFYINMQSIKNFPCESFKRFDRNEIQKVYKIPKEYLFNGWDNLQKTLIQFKINTVF